MLLAASLGPLAAGAQTPDECPSPPQIAGELVRDINAIRAEPRQCGAIHYPAAPELTWNEVLFQVAQRHSDDMARRDYFSHVTPEGLTPGQRAAAAGYSWSSQAENIGVGPVSVKDVLRMWLTSPMHCQAMMKREYQDVALACAVGKGKLLWTLELGSQGWEP
ncbi:MAG TPA: CAP domain-containing protein [Methylococcaceae bacterium]|nr:CAP domain-containing protein [Methylococcaceae bacterium]